MDWEAALTRNPVIPALRRAEDLPLALSAPSGAVFLLNADLLNLRRLVAHCHAAGKAVFVHYDLIAGLSADRSGVAFLGRHARPDGLITTRTSVTRFSMEAGLKTVLRIFALDSAALDTALEVIRRTTPHAVEVLPALLPAWVFARIREVHRGPLIAGGLVRDHGDVRRVLAAGATAVSASHAPLWLPPPGHRNPDLEPGIES